MNLSALVLLPFALWHFYRIVRALRSGVFKYLGGTVERLSQGALFWFRVARELVLGALFVALCVSLLLGFGVTAAWLVGGYAVVYIALVVATATRSGAKRLSRPLERTDSAGGSAPIH